MVFQLCHDQAPYTCIKRLRESGSIDLQRGATNDLWLTSTSEVEEGLGTF